MSGRFGTVITAMVTPFDGKGALDVDAAVALARWLTDNGSDGLVLTGTTGEGPVLTDEEDVELWRAVAEAVTVPVVAGTGTNDTRHSIELTKRAEECGVAGALVVTPYYNRPPQAGLEAHFRAVASATKLPILIYDIPIRTGRRVARDTFVSLSDVGNIVGVKDAALDVAGSAALRAAMPDSFEIYSGNDDQTLALMAAAGAVGVISVASHWAGVHMAEMVAAAEKGDLAHARQVNQRLLASYDFETSDSAPNPIPTKAMMRVLGHAVGQCRLPMGPAPEGLEDEARRVLANLQRA
ncbi:MAG TPA: 4-hydroxy-tetrahydrodipicolinate synthase [Acidimicrobiales bacterium]|jgi:4-hydroxy-tetrahydrodipicolinate synthase|nr:4-hydroxy-tetrahydrodipicolinate synthase [Acidimicrobiales bacterium]